MGIGPDTSNVADEMMMALLEPPGFGVLAGDRSHCGLRRFCSLRKRRKVTRVSPVRLEPVPQSRGFSAKALRG